MRSLLRAIMIALFAFAFVSLVSGCMQTYHERDGELSPNRPSPEQLRQICPF